MIKKSSLNEIILVFAVCLAVLTQFPDVNKSVLSTVNYGVWLLLLGYTLLRDFTVYASRNLYFMVSFTGLSFVVSMIFESTGFYWMRYSFIEIMIIPMLVYYICYRVALDSDGFNDSIIDRVIKSYCVMTLIMAFQISLKFVINFSSWQHTETYLYVGGTHKNSTAQILGVCFVVILNYFESEKLLEKLLKWISLGLILIAMLYVQSRAALIAVTACIIINVFLQKELKSAIKYAAVLICVVLIAFSIPEVKEIVMQAFFIDKYSVNENLDMNKFSSGRLDYWKATWSQFCDSPFWGVGHTYCDNFYINVLACGGIFLGFPLIIFFVMRLYRNYTYVKNYINIYEGVMEYRIVRTLGLVSIYYLVTSFFEGYPPYGPGVACLMLWLLCGYVDGRFDNIFKYD